MKYIKELEGLRGLMALWVLVGHWSTTVALSHPLIHMKLHNYAVNVFIIISGFAIAALLDKRPESYRMYIIRRFFRIFPVYLLFLFLSVLAAPWALEIWQHAPEGIMKAVRIAIASNTITYWGAHLLTHITALHGIVPNRFLPSTDYAFLGQAWSISMEWQFYLIAPVFIPLVLNVLQRQVWSTSQAVLMALGTLTIVGISTLMPSGFVGRNLHEFTLGMLSFYLLKQSHLHPQARLKMAYACLLGIMVILFFKSVSTIPYLIWLSVMLSILVKDMPHAGIFTWGSRLLNAAPVQFLGRLSYSIYLSHMLVILVGLKLVESIAFTTPMHQALFLLAFVVPVTLVVSLMSYVVIEKPFHELGKRLKA
ncbi:MAG: acyltransferase [Alphaproteobacteria bacterium]